VFLRPEFEGYAKSNLVLVEIDFPKRKTLPPMIQQQNQKLAEQFQVRAYPTVIVLDAHGTKLGRVNYGAGGPRPFISEIEKLVHPKPDVVPSKPLPIKKGNDSRRMEKASTTIESNRTDLKLQSITGPKKRRQAVINDHAFSAGETMTVKLPAGAVRVHCVEILERSVIVTVNGRREKRELKLAGGT
jgi:hypothetical protein